MSVASAMVLGEVHTGLPELAGAGETDWWEGRARMLTLHVGWEPLRGEGKTGEHDLCMT